MPNFPQSVISYDHPDNSRNERVTRQNYTFRQRVPKLNLTLGWELEANHAPVRIPSGIDRHEDGSVNGEEAEFVVLPAITKSPRYVLGLLKDLVHMPKLNTDESCGFHVHVSASNIPSLARIHQWAIATEYLAKQIEDVAFKAVPDSRKGNQYCKKIELLKTGTSFNVSKYNNSRRYHWLNIVEMFRPGGIRTIENRLLGHTHRWKYVLSWTLFTMELAQRGWELSNKPFDIDDHVVELRNLLNKIEKEIKPLSLRANPIPQWVYDGFKNFGISANSWDRPLSVLSETESEINNTTRVVYSDNQPEIPNPSEDDDESCPCGCGDEGRCQEQTHNDGDCDTYCSYCHDNGDCRGLPRCEYCIEHAHNEGVHCLRDNCRRCSPTPATPPTSTIVTSIHDTLYGRSVTEIITDEITNSGRNVTQMEMPRLVPLSDIHSLAIEANQELNARRIMSTIEWTESSCRETNGGRA